MLGRENEREDFHAVIAERHFQDPRLASSAGIVQKGAMEELIPTSPPSAISIRLLREGDLAMAHQLRAFAGWNQTIQDWQGYLLYEPEGCFVAEVGGKPVGTATTIRYEDKFGWIGMVLVHPEVRRLGVGTRLLRHAISSLQLRGVRCVKLDATPMGRPVYLPLGFVDEYGLARYEGVAPATLHTATEGIKPLAVGDWEELARLDGEAFGAARLAVLRSLSARHPELSFGARRGGELQGFLLARQGTNATQVGPWIAREAETAEKLLGAFLRVAGDRRIFLDVIDPNSAAVAMMAKYGFRVQRTLTRMYLGENGNPGRPSLVFGISSPEKG